MFHTYFKQKCQTTKMGCLQFLEELQTSRLLPYYWVCFFSCWKQQAITLTHIHCPSTHDNRRRWVNLHQYKVSTIHTIASITSIYISKCLSITVYSQKRRDTTIEHMIQHAFSNSFVAKWTWQNQLWNIVLEIKKPSFADERDFGRYGRNAVRTL